MAFHDGEYAAERDGFTHILVGANPGREKSLGIINGEMLPLVDESGAHAMRLDLLSRRNYFGDVFGNAHFAHALMSHSATQTTPLRKRTSYMPSLYLRTM
jgi:hypothetical protein